MAASMPNTFSFEGSNFLRQKLILSTLSGKSVKVKKIRSTEDNPGLRDYEANLIRLLEKLTNGSTIEVNETGTAVFYQPGVLVGGAIQHDCNPARAITYYLEVLLCLAPFTKKPLKASLTGVTNNTLDPSIDVVKASCLPVLHKFLGTDEGLDMKIASRGAAPGGGGHVVFSCPTRTKLRPVNWIKTSKIKRIRGTAWATRVSPATCNRIVDTVRGVLNQLVSDIYIVTDHCKGSQAGKSPGFGITLVAQTVDGAYLCAESCSSARGENEPPTVPEELAKTAAQNLLYEVYRGGCVDSHSQHLACLLMALGDKDVSKLTVGPLTPYTIQLMRHIKDFLQVMFKVDVLKTDSDEADEDQTDSPKVTLTCVGTGFRNIAKVTL